MNILDVINKKRLKKSLTKEEINYVINNYISGVIKDYQMSSLLMAITINGMNIDETYYMTDAMLNSGEIIDLSSIKGIVVDKHSTGGVGDKVTLIMAPILASLGINIAKMSGRGLGFTGGTIDKLESIPGFDTTLTELQFIKQVNSIQLAITSPTKKFDIADKKIYALRDVTGTVCSIPLIASSIMSKKLACNADIIIIDVKVGEGALLKTKKEAIQLSNYLVEIGKRYNKKVFCLLTDMHQPLGYAIGNSLEIFEVIDALNNKGAKDLMEVVYSICSIVISEVKNISNEEAFSLIYESVKSKKAYNKFLEFVKYQKGNITKLSKAKNKIEILSSSSGYIKDINTFIIASNACNIGAGKITLNDKIDHEVGIVLNKKIGDEVQKGELLAIVYYNSKKPDINEIKFAFDISSNFVESRKTVYGLINNVK